MQAVNDAPGAPKPVGNYSQAIDTGALIFCAGQIGINPETSELISDDVTEQTHQVMKNIQAVLRFAGSHMDRIAMTTIFLDEIADGAIVNEIYGSYIDKSRAPARQTVAVKALPLGAKVEISVVATKG